MCFKKIIMIILIIFAFVGGLYWLLWLIHSYRMDRMTAKLPSPSGFPVLGNAMLFIGNNKRILKNIQDLAQMALDQNGASKIWLGPNLYVALGNPTDAQVILDNFLEKDVVYRFLQPWLGHGLFVAPLDIWKPKRKSMLPVFHNKVIEQYLGIIAEQSQILVNKLEEQVGKGFFDVHQYITPCTLDIVFETAMGERMDVQKYPETPYLKARNTVISILNMRLFKVWLQPDCLFNLTPYAKQQRENIDLTHKFTNEVVQKRRSIYEKNKNNTEAYRSATDGKQSVLDLLFGKDMDLSNKELQEDIDSITIAGNDTTSLVISYTLVLLGEHIDIQEKAFQEQISIFGSSQRGATKDDLQNMHFLERIVKESMRLYTVVPIIARSIDKDVYLPECDVTLPAGSHAVVGSFAIHKSKKVWGDNAEEFDPDRFLPERSVDRHPAAFLPFSYGSRNCIGRNFGMIIIKSILSSIIRKYKITSDGVGPLKIEMLLFPINGHQIQILNRP